MSTTHIFLEKKGDNIGIHFDGEVDFIDFSQDLLDNLLTRGVEILAFSSKFNNTNQKSEIMPTLENKAEATQFESIANRADTCRSRVLIVTNLLHLCVDNIDGPGPPRDEKETHKTPSDSILSGLDRLLSELESQINDLEHEQNRLSQLLSIHL